MQFNELNDKQKEKALDQYRYINVDDTDYDLQLRFDFIDKMKLYGFTNINIMVDVSCTQGSGASFDTKYVDIETYLRKSKQWSKYRSLHEMIRIKDIECTIERSNHARYVHSNMVEANIETWQLDLSAKQLSLVESLTNDITNFVRSESDSLHSDIENLMLELISDDSVKNTIEANDMEFEIKELSVTYL